VGRPFCSGSSIPALLATFKCNGLAIGEGEAQGAFRGAVVLTDRAGHGKREEQAVIVVSHLLLVEEIGVRSCKRKKSSGSYFYSCSFSCLWDILVMPTGEAEKE
jgi:hypothetical protein